MKKLLKFSFLVFLFFNSCKNSEKDNTLKTKKTIVDESSVLNQNQIKLQEFIIDSSKDTVLIGESNTRVFIDKNTFVKANGEKIEGKIKVELKEVISIVDIAKSNLTTTSNGELLQSGGMVYLNAFSDNEELEIAVTKSVKIALPSKEILTDMNIYQGTFDSVNNIMNWVNPEKNILNSQLVNSKTKFKTLNKELIGESVLIEPKEKIEQPKKPLLFNSQDERILSFVIEDEETLPELRAYENVKFRVLESCEYNPNDANAYFYDVSLDKKNVENVYQITFKGTKNNQPFIKKYDVSPVFDGKDYDLALKEYNTKFAAYEKKKAENELQRNKELEEIKRKLEAQQKINFNISSNNLSAVDPSLNYIFNLKKLGWCNIDRIYNNPNLQPVDLFAEVLNSKEKGTIYFSLIVRKLNMNIPGYMRKDNTISFSINDNSITKLPVGEEGIVLATSKCGDKIYYSIKKLLITKNIKFNLTLNEISSDELNRKLETEL